MGPARYDEHAAWYDERSQGERHPDDCEICAAIMDLDDGRAGVVADIGCGGAAHRRALHRSRRRVVGFDVSFQQLCVAKPRLGTVVLGDACRMPLPAGQIDAVNLTFVDTDVADPAALMHEVARVLQPSGQLVLVGAHPCFNGPSFERRPDGTFVVHPGYLQSGWYADGPGFGDGIRRRVGFYHRTLSEVFNDLLTTGLRIRRIGEYGDDPPFLLGIAAERDPGP